MFELRISLLGLLKEALLEFDSHTKNRVHKFESY